MKLSLITPTSDRPKAFALCERHMARQENPPEHEWIVADDGRAPAVCTMGQRVIRSEPSADPKQSFLGNLQMALLAATGDAVLVIEDDDWYSPQYLRFMHDLAQAGHDVFGEGRAKYYNVASRRWHVHRNLQHASLCQTGFSRRLLPWLVDQVAGLRSVFVDLHLWRHGPTRSKLVLPESRHCVGLKGVEGKAGLGMGHRLDERYPVDRTGEVLRDWIGEDVRLYL